jgi:hypothetical protein
VRSETSQRFGKLRGRFQLLQAVYPSLAPAWIGLSKFLKSLRIRKNPARRRMKLTRSIWRGLRLRERL